jgi:SAM-dependent methyltransferase
VTAASRLLRHPVRSADLAYRRVTAPLYRRFTRAELDSLRRDTVERCWCGGELEPFAHHPSYGVCKECGCYVNTQPPAADELARLYSLDFYWHGRVRTKGQPPIEKRAGIDRSDGRVEFWRELVERYAPEARTVVEVGCGSGVLLEELEERGYACVGLEPDDRTARWATARTGVEVRAGLFPDADVPECDIFLAFDVIEHTPDPRAFVRRLAEVLRPGGVAILQTPIDRYPELERPFGSRFRDAFDDVEHCFLFTDEAVRRLAADARLEVVSLDERLWLHHEIAVFAKR